MVQRYTNISIFFSLHLSEFFVNFSKYTEKRFFHCFFMVRKNVNYQHRRTFFNEATKQVHFFFAVHAWIRELVYYQAIFCTKEFSYRN